MSARRLLLALHALLVLAGLAYLALAAGIGSEDANIGLGLALLWLAALAVPWSLVLLADLTGAVVVVIAIGGALANLGLHAWWVRRAS